MNFIEKVIVEGFWGDRSLEFDFFRDVNFIIGINGSGKTTAVNIVVAALTADFAALDRLEFSKISIKLKSADSRKKPSVVIHKKTAQNTPFARIVYEIKESASDKALVLSINDYEEQMMLRRYSKHRLEREMARRHGQSVQASLAKLVNVSWLSVHRARMDRNEYDDEKYASTVDRKLKELSNRMVRYFSTLGETRI